MTLLSVPDMSCGHCKASVEAALTPLAETVTVDLPGRRVSVEGGEDQQLLKALDAIGFPAQIIPG
ncbi:heavy-metal-associated domain-containing protein [Pseudotabrizicola sp. 4114]|uniref:heavy-metal-associated domain-containing protein n=1 Tax=Pseudotabrizicola sp. 4114 TaxID=2817731 RepID=UPI0028614104|nr:copper chaperone [Pseudorhodobacter sp. 4114]